MRADTICCYRVSKPMTKKALQTDRCIANGRVIERYGIDKIIAS